MKRKASIAEFQARIQAGDRSFLGWLQSHERRQELAANRESEVFRFLSAYFRKIASQLKGGQTIWDIGCGLGHIASSLLRLGALNLRYVGLDYDPTCIQDCRKRFHFLTSYQFHAMDYCAFPKVLTKPEFIVVSGVLNSLPTYEALISHCWESAESAVLLVFDSPLVVRESDYLAVDPQERRVYASHAQDKFLNFTENKLGVEPEWVTLYSDTSQTKRHVALLRHTDTAPDLSALHHFREDGRTFPFYALGIQ